MSEEYRHKEAFCLMWYACDNCGHKERIWNSRDGVTPFGMNCPSCGSLDLTHASWNEDQRVVEHGLLPGQRFWRDGTKEEAVAILKRRFALFEKKGQAVPDETKEQMLANLDAPPAERHEFQDGWPTIETYAP